MRMIRQSLLIYLIKLTYIINLVHLKLNIFAHFDLTVFVVCSVLFVLYFSSLDLLYINHLTVI